MIHIKYKLNTSDIHGVGLFTAQPIKQGDFIYTASPLLDLNISQDQFDRLK